MTGWKRREVGIKCHRLELERSKGVKQLWPGTPDDILDQACREPGYGDGRENKNENLGGISLQDATPAACLACAQPVQDENAQAGGDQDPVGSCLLYTSPSPRDGLLSR